MWYYEFWCEGGFLHKSDMFETEEEAIEEAERDIDYEVSLEPTRKREDYSYELYCTCEDEEEENG